MARTTTTREAPAAATAPTVRPSMPPIANHGTGDRARRVAHGLQPDGGPAELGRRRVHGADGDVVDVERRGGVGLCDAVRGQADQAVGPDDRARRGHGLVVLADVDAVGAGRHREVGPVVEHEQRARVVAQRAGLGRDAQQLVVAGELVAQLEDVDAAGQRRGQHVAQRPASGAAVADEVQAGLRQACATVGQRVHPVDSVAAPAR